MKERESLAEENKLLSQENVKLKEDLAQEKIERAREMQRVNAEHRNNIQNLVKTFIASLEKVVDRISANKQ